MSIYQTNFIAKPPQSGSGSYPASANFTFVNSTNINAADVSASSIFINDTLLSAPTQVAQLNVGVDYAYTGGTPSTSDTYGAVKFHNVTRSAVSDIVWTFTCTQDNFATAAAAGGGNAAAYFGAIKESTGPTFCAVFNVKNPGNSTTGGLVITEFDFVADGSNPNNTWVCQDIIARQQSSPVAVSSRLTVSDCLVIRPSVDGSAGVQSPEDTLYARFQRAFRLYGEFTDAPFVFESAVSGNYAGKKKAHMQGYVQTSAADAVIQSITVSAGRAGYFYADIIAKTVAETTAAVARMKVGFHRTSAGNVVIKGQSLEYLTTAHATFDAAANASSQAIDIRGRAATGGKQWNMACFIDSAQF